MLGAYEKISLNRFHDFTASRVKNINLYNDIIWSIIGNRWVLTTAPFVR